jgi:hypothetical protein
VLIEVVSIVTKIPDNVPARACGLPVDHPTKVVKRHPADSNPSPSLEGSPPITRNTTKTHMLWYTEDQFREILAPAWRDRTGRVVSTYP